MDKSSADIRIGDLWGKTYEQNEEGVSALVSFTDKGRQIIEGLEDVTLIEHPFSVVSEGQMKKNAQRKPFSYLVMNYLRKGKPIDTIYFKSLLFVLKVVAKFKSIFKS